MDKTIFEAKKIHFTGIKGVGMTAAAICAQDAGAIITGSDLDEEFVTSQTLKQRNIIPKSGFNPNNIDSDTELLVYTGAHQGINNPEVIAAQERDLPAISLAQATGQLMDSKLGVSVCGVGGKTTTTAMIATIFQEAAKDPSFLIGVANVSSLKFPGKYNSQGKHFIVEADEYATSPGTDNTPRFMHLSPHCIVCTNISYDHPDIYKNLQDTLEAYRAFFAKIPQDGCFIYNSDCQNTKKLLDGIKCKKIAVGSSSLGDYHLDRVQIVDGEQLVAYTKNNQSRQFSLLVPGEYNVKNALMASAAAEFYGIGPEIIKNSLLKFRGVNRRFQLVGNQGGVLFYDDYAHHPSEISSTLKAAKDWFPGRRIIAIFQPHTFSRTKVLLEQFAGSFNFADKVIVTEIFPSAREKIDTSINSQILVQKISENHPDVNMVNMTDLVEYTNKIIKSQDILLTIGAGDVYTFHKSYFKKFAGKS